MDWVILSLLSRALWAADNIVDKLLRGKHLPDSLVLTLIAGISALFLSIIITIFNGLMWIGVVPVVFITFAGASQIVAIFAFYQAISKEEISRVIPLFQFIPPLVLILSFLFLGEVLTFSNYIAFMLILIGGFLISLQKIGGIFKLREAFWWMMLSSLIYAVQAVILKSLYVNHSFWDLTAYLGFAEFLPILILLLLVANFRDRFTKSLRNLKPAGWLLLILGMIFITTATLSGLRAFVTGPVGLISAFRGFQSVFVLIYAVVLSIWLPKILKEELGKGVLIVKVVAIFLMMIGIYMTYI